MAAVYLRARPYAADAMNLPVATSSRPCPFTKGSWDSGSSSARTRRAGPPSWGATPSASVWPRTAATPPRRGASSRSTTWKAPGAELRGNGLTSASDFRVDRYGETAYRVFFVVAPDGLCYCLGERQA